ncbi:hypothetical protein [Oceanobacillus kimchii]|uniref:Uncharacterized protein n=1 Tax=Oceanobacillus kimchii TaxID=746691 RepID=A0ABQ5TH97_9BACI|nr:hypothetical protein [Oceanobacillus kimchii]GLO66248.1 hypothetical protein MACH08_20320 [Oceanobacillus kimchii]
MRKFLCQVCREKDIDDNMTIVKVGKSNKRYHTVGCYDRYLEDLEFKKKEKQEFDILCKTIESTCDITSVPPSLFGLLQKLRNGDKLTGGGSKTKHYKKGYSYLTIAEAYMEKEGLIRWKKDQWDGSTPSFLSFVLFWYVSDACEDADVKIQKQKRLEEDKKEIDQSYDFSIDSFNYKDKKDDGDITDML